MYAFIKVFNFYSRKMNKAIAKCVLTIIAKQLWIYNLLVIFEYMRTSHSHGKKIWQKSIVAGIEYIYQNKLQSTLHYMLN